MAAHPGFKAVQSKIAGEGYSKRAAGAILANATRHASASAKKKNPHLKRVKGKMHEGGVIPSDGLYEMKAGEMVTPNHEGSDSYIQGSEGSRMCKSNIKVYRDEHLDEASPAMTDHPYGPAPSAYHYATETEQIRRESNRMRDRRKRWSVLTSPIAVDTNSDAEKNAENISGKRD